MIEEQFVKEVAQKLRDGLCDLFVGSGISAPSGLPTWSSFLEPFLKELGIKINDNDDLPLLAQFILNRNIGNRNIFSDALHDTFGKDFPTNNYHRIISNFPVTTIWTTNYDNLLEKAFSEKNPRTIISEDSLIHPYLPQNVEIIKLHGDAKNAAKGIVLTKDDYNNFLYNKPMLAQRLREAIINRSLLFLGYSYQDMNIQNIMAQAANMKEKTTNSHYILLCEIEQKEGESEEAFSQRKNRFDLWLLELNRIGLRELVVPKNRVEELLRRIEHEAREFAVYVTGSHNATDKEKDLAQSIGCKLAENNKVLLNCGQSTGIGNSAMSGFMDTVLKNKQEINQRMRIFPNPYAISPDYSNNPALLPSLKAVRIPMLDRTSIVISFRGGMGTEAEVELALAKGRIVLPIIEKEADYNNSVIAKILSDHSNLGLLETVIPEYCKILKEHQTPNHKQILDSICEVLSDKKQD